MDVIAAIHQSLVVFYWPIYLTQYRSVSVRSVTQQNNTMIGWIELIDNSQLLKKQLCR
jgi:hypothetical protein